MPAAAGRSGTIILPQAKCKQSLSLRQKHSTPLGVLCFCIEGFERSNATRMSVARCGWTQRNNNFATGKMQTIPLTPPKRRPPIGWPSFCLIFGKSSKKQCKKEQYFVCRCLQFVHRKLRKKDIISRGDKMDYLENARIRDLVWKVLLDLKIRELPIKIGEICNKLEIAVHYYTPTDGKDGFCTQIDGKPHIFISDRISPERQRFTAAHELGHILLGHIESNGSNKGRIGDSVDSRERAANVFAGRLLAPGCVLWALNAYTPEEIASLCQISRQAGAVRADQMSRYRKSNKFLTSPLEKRVYRRFKRYIKRKKRGEL